MNQRPPIHQQSGHADPGLTLLTSRFSTRDLARDQQVLAWRTRVGHVVDVPPSREQLTDGFGADIDLFSVNGSVFTDVRSAPMALERSVARVSSDSRRDYVFHLALEGETGNVTGMRKKRSAPGSTSGLIALDLNQPFRIERPACRLLSLFVPGPTVNETLPDAESIHGRILPFDSPLTRLALDHLAATRKHIATLAPNEVAAALEAGGQLLIAAFREGTSLTGASRAAVQAVIMAKVRRYVEANLHQAELTPASVVDALQLKRATIYRWFQHEGGLGTYIRNRRLREAANELARFPQRQVTEIAYGLGFKSGSDFTRAFRRAFDVSPLDMRAHALTLLHGNVRR